ncbi:MAG: biotin transporter BioY [Verrucomicrobiota bacterium]
MQYATPLTDNFLTIRQKAFAWRSSASIGRIAMAGAVTACATGLLAQIRIPLPWTPIPLTGQTFAVLVAGALLGKKLGALSMGMYMFAGAAGIPWFAGAAGGLAVLTGPTGGYIAGFVLAALFVGAMADRFPLARQFWPMAGIMLAADYLLIHGLGIFQFGLWSIWISGQYSGITELLIKGTLPFLAVDAIKILAAAAVATALLQKDKQT